MAYSVDHTEPLVGRAPKCRRSSHFTRHPQHTLIALKPLASVSAGAGRDKSRMSSLMRQCGTADEEHGTSGPKVVSNNREDSQRDEDYGEPPQGPKHATNQEASFNHVRVRVVQYSI